MDIPYGSQDISRRDIRAVKKSLRNRYLTTGPLVEEFERLLENRLGAPAVVLTSGTAALHAAYYAIGLSPGDEIITTPMTFVATQATARMFGANIVFADIEMESGNIDPNVVENLITHRTKAIVGVDYAGQPINLDKLSSIAKKHGIYLIEDAAHSLGSSYKFKPVGSIADITTFSFFPTKNITSGEGGAITSLNPELLRRAKLFSRQGLIRDSSQFKLNPDGPWHQEVHDFGLNYRLPDPLCALGISQLQKVEKFKFKRKQIRETYIKEIKKHKIRAKTLSGSSESDPMWHLFPIFVDEKERTRVYESLHRAGIKVQINYIPTYWHPAFLDLGYERGLCPNAEKFYSQEISLPLHTRLSASDQNYVLKMLKLCVGFD